MVAAPHPLPPGGSADAKTLVTRRRVVALLGGAGALAAGYQALRPTVKPRNLLRIGTMSLQNPDLSGDWIALDRGLFDRHGVIVEHRAGGPNAPPALTLLSAGRIDMAKTNWFSFIDAVGRGGDFVIVGASSPHNPNCLISRPVDPIRRAADIPGKRLLLQFKEYSEIIAAILKYNHLPPDFTVSPAGFSAEAMFAGDGDGYFAFLTGGPINLELSGKKNGVDFLVTPLSTMGYRIPDGLFVVRRETLKTKRDILARYFRAVLEGLDIAAREPARGAALTVDTYAVDAGINLRNQIRAVQAYLPLSTAPRSGRRFDIPSETVPTMYDFARLAGRTVLPPPGRIFDLGPLHDAWGTA